MNRTKSKLALLVCVTCGLVSSATTGLADNAATVPLSETFQLVSAEKDAKLRGQLPKVDDQQVQAILDDPALILYTEQEIPAAYQDWGSGLEGIHSPSYNISANGSEPHGNGNIEFPWGAPGGTHRTKNVNTFRFLWLPSDDSGKLRPIVWYRASGGYAWTFPLGTVVGEVLQIRSPEGQRYTFELRVRTREYGEWSVDVFRPFPTSDRLAERIRQLRPDWSGDDQLTKLVSHLDQPIELKELTLSDKAHPRRTFRQTMGIDTLPEVGDAELVAQLLTETPFQSALGATWRVGRNDARTVAPTTDAEFHIVPAQYDAGFIDVDRVSCMRCHETVNGHVNEFDFGRDWYGRVRGSDGIFSIHPFDRACISRNGNSLPVRINPKLTQAGVFEEFSRDKHDSEIYQQLFDPQG